MANYLLAFHGGGMPQSEQEKSRIMSAWNSWYDKLGDAVIDPGNPVGMAKTVMSDGAISEGGGPNPISGYNVLKANSLDAAVMMAKGCPILNAGGTVEVAETFEAM